MSNGASRRLAIVALCGALLAVSRTAAAQDIPKSQLATVTQDVAGTHLEILYRRPVARGRALFGALVPWGRIWTPSADSAARFTTSAPITVNGEKLAAGAYSIWAIPDAESWTIIFNSTAAVFHLHYPDGHEVLRVHVVPQRGDHVESLMFAFPMVDADSAQLQIRWGTTVIPLAIRSAGGGR
jgi:hypothetical protein